MSTSQGGPSDSNALTEEINRLLPNTCPFRYETVNCDNERWSKYRSADGMCNNVYNPHWGSSNIPLERLAPAFYEDSKAINYTIKILSDFECNGQ